MIRSRKVSLTWKTSYTPSAEAQAEEAWTTEIYRDQSRIAHCVDINKKQSLHGANAQALHVLRKHV